MYSNSHNFRNNDRVKIVVLTHVEFPLVTSKKCSYKWPKIYWIKITVFIIILWKLPLPRPEPLLIHDYHTDTHTHTLISTQPLTWHRKQVNGSTVHLVHPGDIIYYCIRARLNVKISYMKFHRRAGILTLVAAEKNIRANHCTLSTSELNELIL